MSLHATSETPWYGFIVTWPNFKNSKTSSALEILTVKHVLSVTCCHFLPSLLDDVFTCEELESIKKAKKLGCILSM